MNFEYLELSELRTLLDEKKVSSVELTRYFLDRAKKINPSLNAYLTICEEHALKQAAAADERIAKGETTLLLGIPYAAKDLFCTKGIRTTASSKILDSYIPTHDATVIEKLNEQGAVLLGKTNLDEFAHGSSTETSAYGPTHNPWDTSRMPGGSSGGSSAAVAAGIAPFALATETGGSIRQPSSLCGISGWKPTYGRVSRHGVISMASSLDSIGTMGYSVRDLALTAEVLSGKDWAHDSTTGTLAVPAYSKELNSNMKGVKVGIPKEYFTLGMDPEVKSTVMAAIKELEKCGAEIVEVSLPNTKYGSLVYAIICPSEISSNLARFDGIRFPESSQDAKTLAEVYDKTRGEGFGIEAQRRILTGTYVLSHGYYDAYYKKAQKVRGILIREFNEVFKSVDVLAAPATPTIAEPLGHAEANPLHGYIADQLNIPGSMAGLPALSIPCGFSQNMPVGLQIIGPQWGEQKVFNVGHAYQTVTDWHTKHPPEV